MAFDLVQLLRTLQNTPAVLRTLLNGLDGELAMSSGQEDHWYPFDIVGHFIHGEKTDWIPRAQIILSEEGSKSFEPFDRLAQIEASRGLQLAQLLDEFEALRAANIKTLLSWELNEQQLAMKGQHPEFGEVTLKEMLAAWLVHEHAHVAQICRILAQVHKTEVGPWFNYMPILSR